MISKQFFPDNKLDFFIVMAQGSGRRQFSSSDCKAALKDTLQTFNLPENQAKLIDLTAAAGNDMLKFMQTVFPALTQMQMGVIQVGYYSDF